MKRKNGEQQTTCSCVEKEEKEERKTNQKLEEK